jgi:hypothetical protein
LLPPDLHPFLTPDSKDAGKMCNFIVAPWTEEIIFQAYMVPPMLTSGMMVHQVTMVALFFLALLISNMQ